MFLQIYDYIYSNFLVRFYLLFTFGFIDFSYWDLELILILSQINLVYVPN